MEGAVAALVTEANPEGITGATEHQAVGKGLLEPFKIEKDLFERQRQQNTTMTSNHRVVLDVPVGNGNKGSSIVLTRLPGLIKGQQIFSHPVARWTVPLPALRGEENEINPAIQRAQTSVI